MLPGSWPNTLDAAICDTTQRRNENCNMFRGKYESV